MSDNKKNIDHNPLTGADPSRLHELRRFLTHKLRKGRGGSGDLDYIDARQAMDLLDEVVGPENWERKHDKDGWCTVSIFINGRWVSKTDRGTQSTFEKEKGESSDSFKRACVNWGIGRFLYCPESKSDPQRLFDIGIHEHGYTEEQIENAISKKGLKKEDLTSLQIDGFIKAMSKKKKK